MNYAVGILTRSRYEKTWNLSGTWCRFLDTPEYTWDIPVTRLLAAVQESVRRY